MHIKKRQKIRKGLLLLSFFIFPAVFYYFSPALILEAASQGIVNGSFIVFILLFLSSLIFGRGFCGWVCPAAGCQEAMFLARDKKVTRGNLIKWIIWIPWIGSILALLLKSGGVRQIDFFYKTTYGISIGNLQSFLVYLFVLLILIVLPSFVFGRRSFCHHLCWMAPFMITGRHLRNATKWPSLHLSAKSDRCIHCKVCTENCPMSLPVDAMVKDSFMENQECILCGNCADCCAAKVITISFLKA
jgi:polyferredoxin